MLEDIVITTVSDNSLHAIFSYDAFGNEKNPADADVNPFRYCGEYFDKETGSIYLRARYYVPGLGRFTTQDPIRDGLNWYTYCGNNPIGLIDPLGLDPIPGVGGYSKLKDNKPKYSASTTFYYGQSGTQSSTNRNGSSSGDGNKTAYTVDYVSSTTFYAQQSGIGFPSVNSSYHNKHSASSTFYFQQAGVPVSPVLGYNREGTTYSNHYARDFVIPQGTPVVASIGGKIIDVTNMYPNSYNTYPTLGYGNYVVVEMRLDGKNYRTWYAHLQENENPPNVGDYVLTGQAIGFSGHTGGSEGPHLHFEIREYPYAYPWEGNNYTDNRIRENQYTNFLPWRGYK